MIDGIEIHGLKAFEWLKLIEMHPKDSPVLKLLKGYPLDSENDEIEANVALLVEEKETFCKMIDDAPVVISTESKESEV